VFLIDTALAGDTNQIAICTPLATATDSLILLVSFCLRMPVHPWMFWTCLIIDLYCIIGLTCMIASPLLPTMSTSYCHSLHLPISLCCYCVIELYWLVLLPCIIALYCVFAYTPQSTVSTGFTLFLTHMSACDCISLAGRTIYLYCYLCITTDIDIYCWYFVCSHNCWGQSPLPSPLQIPFKLRQVWCFASYCWLIAWWLWCSLCCPATFYIFGY